MKKMINLTDKELLALTESISFAYNSGAAPRLDFRSREVFFVGVCL